MNYTPEQIAEVVFKVLKELKITDVLYLPYKEKIELAENSNTPVEILKVLATDNNAGVRRAVAQNPNTPVETIKTRATDEHWWVRCGVAWNSNTPVETLEVLATDADANVRESAKESLRKMNEIKTLELTPEQYDALKKLIESGQSEVLKGLMDA